MRFLYARLAQAAGLGALVVAAYVYISHSITSDDVILVGLGVFTGWLRFHMAPTGYLTLSPIAFFLALLLVDPWSALAVTVVSIILSSLLFRKKTLMELLQEVGEEAIPSLGAVLFFLGFVSLLSPSGWRDSLVGYSGAVAVYVALRLWVGTSSAFATEGIGIRAYLAAASRKTVANMLLLAGIALALRAFLYDQFGYLAMILVTVALVEFYHPWKLLSEQDEVLFANLAMVAQAIDIKDPYTARHSRNVSSLAVRISRTMGLPEEEVRKIRIGALMHDIGKIGVSTSIIRKPTRLDTREEQVMRAHPVISADIMQPIELLAEAAEIVRHHHEHLDGSGYPSGLRASSIPIGSRVILVADAFDAMTTDRPYRRGRSKEEALKVLKEHAGRQFDQEVVRALETILPQV